MVGPGLPIRQGRFQGETKFPLAVRPPCVPGSVLCLALRCADQVRCWRGQRRDLERDLFASGGRTSASSCSKSALAGMSAFWSIVLQNYFGRLSGQH